jgi:methionyl aminopeptidase
MYEASGDYINTETRNFYLTNLQTNKKSSELFTNITSLELRGVKPILNDIKITNILPNNMIDSLNYSGTVHKQIRKYLQTFIKPGIKLIDIAKFIEEKTKELTNSVNTINNGIGFPVGLSVNDCAAHWHPPPNDKTILSENDIIKIDYGIEVNEWIIDSAFTVYFDPKYDILANAVKDATYTGIKNAGIDVDIGEWGKEIQEVMESYDTIKSISNLGGHNITKGIIHGGMFLPAVDMREKFNNYRFKEGVYAIETFGSNGDNKTFEKGEPYLYRLNPIENNLNKLKSGPKRLLRRIKKSFNTLPFTDRYLEDSNISDYRNNLLTLSTNNFIKSYPPLCINNGYTAQYEHTIYLGDNKKIIFSQGEDY